MAGIRTPLARARGMGSSKHGVGHFIAQRVTAIALVLLVLWAVLSALALARADYDSAANWLRSPINATLACLLAIAAFWHMQLGMRTIIEDYLAKPGAKGLCLVLNVFVTWGGGAVTVISILKVAFSSSGMNV
jgi:succinate dehydrogenase / fumarate reductase, membrane anchor subunit